MPPRRRAWAVAPRSARVDVPCGSSDSVFHVSIVAEARAGEDNPVATDPLPTLDQHGAGSERSSYTSP